MNDLFFFSFVAFFCIAISSGLKIKLKEVCIINAEPNKNGFFMDDFIFTFSLIACQVSDIVLNEASKNTENAL
jgi:hypothetical protein